MADEPKAPRKRASKKAAEVDTTSEAPTEKKTRKKAVPAVVATPIFQAAPVEAVTKLELLLTLVGPFLETTSRREGLCA